MHVFQLGMEMEHGKQHCGLKIFDEEYTEQAFNFIDLTGLANRLSGSPQIVGATFTYFFGD